MTGSSKPSKFPTKRAPGPGVARRAAGLSLTALLVTTALLAAASEAPPESPAEAIRTVLERDRELGATRNHQPERDSLANTVRDYAAGLDGIDFSACPKEFTAAFRRHRDAWQAAIEPLGKYDDLRGELHQLFDQIRARGGEARKELESLEEQIWGTWKEVEEAARAHGALEAESP